MQADVTNTKTTVNGVTLSESHYRSGLAEIGAYLEPVLPGAARILVAVASRQPGPGCKWCLYTTATSASFTRHTSKAKTRAALQAYGESREAELKRFR